MRITKYSATLGLALGTLLVAGAGCAGTTTTNTTTTNNASGENLILSNTPDQVSIAPTISIVEPATGDTVASTFNLTVAIENFTLAPDKVEGANAEGEGHYHVFVDGAYLVPGVADTTEIKDLAAGDHEIYVSLQNNDHTDLTTPVKSDPITVTVE